jgi:hypothetical protein
MWLLKQQSAFAALWTHSQQEGNSKMTQNYKTAWHTPTSTLNGNSNLALRFIIAVAISI